MKDEGYDDFCLWLSILKRGRTAYGLNEDLARYRVRGFLGLQPPGALGQMGLADLPQCRTSLADQVRPGVSPIGDAGLAEAAGVLATLAARQRRSHATAGTEHCDLDRLSLICPGSEGLLACTIKVLFHWRRVPSPIAGPGLAGCCAACFLQFFCCVCLR